MNYSSQQAEILALKALEWMGTQDGLLEVFLGNSGASVDDLRHAATDQTFLAAVMDFLLQSDEHVIDFAEFAAISPNDPYLARQALPGGDLPNWT